MTKIFNNSHHKFLIAKAEQTFVKILIRNLFVIFIVFFLLSFFSFVNVKKNLQSNLWIIDLTKLPVKENHIPISQFASEITYLQLENNEKSLIGPGAKFFLFDSIVICCAHHQLLTFNSQNGRFIRSIGSMLRVL